MNGSLESYLRVNWNGSPESYLKHYSIEATNKRIKDAGSDAETLKVVREVLRQLGLTVKLSDGEYRVNFIGGREGTAYYTADISDAFDTGIAMAKEGLR